MSHLDRPAILHVFTQKGKGFAPAEKAVPAFHSTSPFKILNGDTIEPVAATQQPSFTNIFGQHLVRLAEKNEKIVALTSAMCDGTGLTEFRQKFPDRFYDVGIAESVAVDIAAGLARCGARPVVCIYSTFLQRSFDQIFQEVALQNLPVVFCIDRAGVVGPDGPTHHGLMDIGFLRMMPNFVLTAPSCGTELSLALDFALNAGGPVVIRYPKDVVPSADFAQGCNKPFELGKSVTVRHSDKSAVAIVAYGSILTEALAAASILAENGIEADVINARFAVPLDEQIVGLAAKVGGIITVEDHSLSCGFGSALLEACAEFYAGKIPAPVKVLAAPKQSIRHNLRKRQFMQAGINADEIVKTAKQMLGAG
jgi:1-deoxy-D-xylulose-5-phosphate synthase